MFSYERGGKIVVQQSTRMNETTYKVLVELARVGGYKSLNALISSILFEIALDNLDLLPKEDLTNKKRSRQSYEVRVA